MPKTEMFAANHGQNKSEGFAVRSDSGTISMPRVSTTGALFAVSVLCDIHGLYVAAKAPIMVL